MINETRLAKLHRRHPGIFYSSSNSSWSWVSITRQQGQKLYNNEKSVCALFAWPEPIAQQVCYLTNVPADDGVGLQENHTQTKKPRRSQGRSGLFVYRIWR
ncbi:hypothetical protein V2K88_03340 [Pseudomonas alliivorans]|nr:hypothetical protein [Pseudomonas alliivorans]